MTNHEMLIREIIQEMFCGDIDPELANIKLEAIGATEAEITEIELKEPSIPWWRP